MKSTCLLAAALCSLGAFAQNDPVAPPMPGVNRHLGVVCTPVRPVMPTSILRDQKFVSATVKARIEFRPPGELADIDIDDAGYPALGTAVHDALKKMTCQFDPPLTRPLHASQQFEFRLDDTPAAPSKTEGAQ